MKKILMACSNYWTSCFQVGSHHLAREFVKLGYEVAFISDPISPFHLLRSDGFKERFRIYSSGGVEEGVWTYLPMTLLPPHREPVLQTEWVHRHWHQMTFPNVVRKVKDRGFGEVDILYLDTAVQSFWLGEIRARKSVFRMADKNAGFSKSTAASLRMEEELCQKVDLVACTARSLMKDVKAGRVEHLPNGVPVAHFAGEGRMPEELRSIPKPIAVYCGAIEYWFDYDLVEKLADELPDVSFVIIGPMKENRLQKRKNIHLLGRKAYSGIPDYLKQADVGMIPFDVKKYPDLIHNVNPLKLYEYMACGLPVVATRWEELENIASPAYLCKTDDEFKRSLVHAIQNPKRDFYRGYAEGQDWSKRAKQLIELLI